MARLLKITALLGLMALINPGFLRFSEFLGKAEAHGVGYQASTLKPVSLEFFYSTGDLMSYLEAQVFSPADEKIAYQSGRTDEAGRFAFTPNVPGKWRVVVKDDEGHRAEAEVDVTQEFLDGGSASEPGSAPAVEAKKAMPEGLELYIRAGLGVSLLFNIAAFVLLLKRQRKAA